MVRLPPLSTLDIAWFGLLFSIGLNSSAIYVFRGRSDQCARTGRIGDRRFSYKNEDYPLHVPLVALTTEDSERYSLSDFDAYGDWRSLDVFPKGNGFVQLGPAGRTFGVAMFHQMHCLQVLRTTIVQGRADQHARHCLNFLRQTVLCASDTTLDALDSKKGTKGLGSVHVCRDWQKVYDFVEENHLKHMNVSGWLTDPV